MKRKKKPSLIRIPTDKEAAACVSLGAAVVNYRCCECGREFSSKPGPTECFFCGSVHVENLDAKKKDLEGSQDVN